MESDQCPQTGRIKFQFDKCLPELDFIECDETLDEISNSEDSETHLETYIRTDSAMSAPASVLARANATKRIKRREYKRRLKSKQNDIKEKALKELQHTIKEIYGLRSTFTKSRDQIEYCLNIIKNKDRFYDFINLVIRDQVELIRQEIKDCLQQFSQGSRQSPVPKLYEQFVRIKQASPQVQKIINFFIRKSLKEKGEYISQQKNLDKMTFRFILKQDLHNQDGFDTIRQLVFSDSCSENQREKQMLLLMIDMYDEGIFNNSEDDYYDQYTDNEAEFSTEASVDPDIRGEEDGHCYRQNNWNKQNEEIENESEQKPKRRKKNREDYDFSYEAISNRILEMQFREQDRVQCNVSEQWIDRMRLKANSLKSN